MEIINKTADELIEAEYNPRKITDADFDQLKQSLKKFDVVEPLVINMHPGRKGVIIGGHQRFKAMKSLGYTEFPCVEVSLGKKAEKELNLRLNKNSGEFDLGLLAEHFDVDDLKDIGFEDWELGLDEDDSKKKDISNDLKNEYKLEVDCVDENKLQKLYERLSKEGFECRILTL